MVSIIIPTYNSEKCIMECLDSVVSQTYVDIEIIIVDNLSSDRTVGICKEYADRDKRIKVLSNNKQGVSASRNIGIKHATGDFIVFIDSDDYPERNMIESYISAYTSWKDKNPAIILCGMFFDNEVNKNIDSEVSILEAGYGYIEGENYLLSRSAVSTLSWLKLFNFVTNKFYDLNIIKDNQLKFDENIRIGEDLAFNLDYLDICPGDFGIINKPLYHYIKRVNNSLSLTYHENDIEDTKNVYDRLLAWESKQKGVTKDNILVLEAIYITDWISRITTYYEHFKGTKMLDRCKLREELRCHKFRKMLYEVHKAKKIGTLRYVCLKTGIYEIFYFFRGFYQIMKG